MGITDVKPEDLLGSTGDTRCIVAINARIKALVNNGVRVRCGIIDNVILPKANPVLSEFVQKDKRLGGMDEIHPMRDRLQNRDNGVLLHVDPLLDDERSVNQIMAELGFSGKLMVFDKSRSSRWDRAGLRNTGEVEIVHAGDSDLAAGESS